MDSRAVCFGYRNLLDSRLEIMWKISDDLGSRQWRGCESVSSDFCVIPKKFDKIQLHVYPCHLSIQHKTMLIFERRYDDYSLGIRGTLSMYEEVPKDSECSSKRTLLSSRDSSSCFESKCVVGDSPENQPVVHLSPLNLPMVGVSPLVDVSTENSPVADVSTENLLVDDASTENMIVVGVSPQNLPEVGVSPQNLPEVGVSPQNLPEVGVSSQNLSVIGLSHGAAPECLTEVDAHDTSRDITEDVPKRSLSENATNEKLSQNDAGLNINVSNENSSSNEKQLIDNTEIEELFQTELSVTFVKGLREKIVYLDGDKCRHFQHLTNPVYLKFKFETVNVAEVQPDAEEVEMIKMWKHLREKRTLATLAGKNDHCFCPCHYLHRPNIQECFLQTTWADVSFKDEDENDQQMDTDENDHKIDAEELETSENLDESTSDEELMFHMDDV